MKRYFERYEKEKNRYEQLVEECDTEKRKQLMGEGWIDLTDQDDRELKVNYGRAKGVCRKCGNDALLRVRGVSSASIPYCPNCLELMEKCQSCGEYEEAEKLKNGICETCRREERSCKEVKYKVGDQVQLLLPEEHGMKKNEVLCITKMLPRTAACIVKRNTGEEIEIFWTELHSKADTRRYLQFSESKKSGQSLALLSVDEAIRDDIDQSLPWEGERDPFRISEQKGKVKVCSTEERENR